MNYLATVLNVVCTFNEGYWLIRLIDSLFPLRSKFETNKKIKGRTVPFWISTVGFTLLILVMNSIEKTSVYTAVIGTAFALVLACVIWQCDIVSASGTVGIYFLALLALNLVQLAIVGAIGGDKLLHEAAHSNGLCRVLIYVSAFLVWTSVNMFVQQKIKNLKIDRAGIRYLTTVCASGFVGLMYIFVQMATGFHYQLTLLMVVSFISISALIVVLYFAVKYRILQDKVSALNEQSRLFREDLETVKNYYQANAKLYHDMDNHMRIMQGLLESEESEEAKKYIETLIKPMENYKKDIHTGHKVIDLIINDNKALAEIKGIEYIIEVERLPSELRFDSSDMCILFSNMMRNAMEAVKEQVIIKIRVNKNYLYLEVKNDYKKEPKISDGRYVTIKEDKLSHGWGMLNMQDVIKKYDGNMKCDVSEGKFTALAMLFCGTK